ncbi:hypothetical protein PoB_003492600 [Plakobranchus ocellatus]|uniref:CARD domain-containing protein n=1 Tax=Plakobranchus ocellatus TaxID=259542 RepID=A0AAV4AJF8_9GAST|nr:hypothetical protein PoB_003492600 [Plakobranchus ocellatus]
MEADVALRGGAGEAWSMPPSGQTAQVETAPGRGKKSKAKGRGLPQPVASPSTQHRSRRKQPQQQGAQQLRASRSMDDELDVTRDQYLTGKGEGIVIGDSAMKARGKSESASSSRDQLLTDVQDVLLPGSAARRGSAPGQQSPQLAMPGASRLEKWTPKEQKKSSSRNRRRRAAAAAKKQEMGEVGEQQGGEGMAQSPASPEGAAPALYLETQQGYGSRLQEPSLKKPETRRPSMDSLGSRGGRKHSQQSDDGFFSYEPDYGLDPEEHRVKLEDEQIQGSGGRLKDQSQATSKLPRSGHGTTGWFGYQGNSADSRRRDKGAMGRMVPKPSAACNVGPYTYGSDNVPLEPDLSVAVSCDKDTFVTPEEQHEIAAFSDYQRNVHHESLQGQRLADPHYGVSQSWSSQASADHVFMGDQPQGSNMFPLSSSSAPTPPPALAHRDNSGSVVILEVKDRPGLYYKASERTVSDSPSSVPRDELVMNPAALNPSALHFHQTVVSPHTMIPAHTMTMPHPLVPPHSMLPHHPTQLGSIQQMGFPHHTHGLAQHSLAPTLNPPTQLTYSPQMNQSPLMSSQPQMFTPDKTIPLDLSFSPRNNSPAHIGSLMHSMSHLEQGQPMYPPAPAHCPSPQSRPGVSSPYLHKTSPGFQSKLPGLRRPNLSSLERSVVDDTPLDLSVKKGAASSTKVCSESSDFDIKKGDVDERVPKPLSPVTPPLDLRTSFTVSKSAPVSSQRYEKDSWSPSPPSSTITEQPVSVQVQYVQARDRPSASDNKGGLSSLQVHPSHVTQSEPCTYPVNHQHQDASQIHVTVTNPASMPDATSRPEPAGIDVLVASSSSGKGAPVTAETTAIATTASTSTANQPQVETETAGFLNKSEFLQQRAGIKHDDIVVGPRRPISSLVAPPAAKLNETATTSQPYNTFPPSHARPGIVQPEEESKANSSAAQQGPDCSGVLSEESEQKMSNPEELKSDQVQESQASSSSHSERSASGGSQTIPRRIPRRVQPENSPQISRKKAAGSRLPKPLHGPSPERKASLDSEFSLLPEHVGEDDKLDVSMKQPLLADIDVRKEAKPSGRYTIESVDSDMKKNSKPKKSLEGVEPVIEDSVSPATVTPVGAAPAPKSKQTKATARSALPQAVSATTPPTKRKDVASKLHMLSNIPVPMSHDPRPKPDMLRKKQSVEEEEEDGASDQTPLLRPAARDLGVENGHATGDFSNLDGVCSSSVNSQAPPSEPYFAKNVSGESTTSSLAASPTNGVPFDPKQIAKREENMLKRISEQSAEETPPSRASVIPEESTEMGIAEAESCQNGHNGKDGSVVKQPELASSGHVANDTANKPRLHRSEEQLGGQGSAKLSVFEPGCETATTMVDPRSHVAASVPSSPGTHSPTLKKASHPSASSANAILDTSSEIEKSPPIVKKKSNLPRIGILRRGSDRTAEICRRGSEHRGIMSGIPLSSRRHDPSVEDLKRATSISELCQSVASLLNIDNEKAAAMITGDLSTRQDLVEGLDADAIIDYLCHHGVLDTSALPDIDSKTSPSERNCALLQQVEGRGTTAVALFVNALRQSGQLHLASSLDTEQRIRPSASGGYFGKGRHKGEVTVRIEVEFLKILAPRELRPDKVVDASLLNDQLDGVVVKDDDEDEDMVKPRCWCFCLSSRRSKVKERKKKQQQTMSPPPASSTDNSVERNASEGRQGRTKKQPKKPKEKNKGKKSSSASAKQDHQYQSAKYSMVEPSRDQMDGNIQDLDHSDGRVRLQPQQQQHESASSANKNFSSTRTTSSINGKNGGGGKTSVPPHRDKSRLDPIIMEYDPHLELVKLRAGQDELASPTRQQMPPQHHIPGTADAAVGMLVEQWRSSGPHFQRKATQLCARLVQAARDDLVRYFEQDRGTLVLDVVQDGSAVLVINICMMAAQVRCLKKDVVEAEDGDKGDSNGVKGGLTSSSSNKNNYKSVMNDKEEEEEESFLDKLQSILFSHVDIRDFDIRGIKLHLALDTQQVDAALSELS